METRHASATTPPRTTERDEPTPCTISESTWTETNWTEQADRPRTPGRDAGDRDAARRIRPSAGERMVRVSAITEAALAQVAAAAPAPVDVVDRLIRIIGRASFDRYFHDRASVRIADGRVEVHADSRAAADMLKRRFSIALRQAGAGGGDAAEAATDLVFIVADQPVAPVADATAVHAAPIESPAPQPVRPARSAPRAHAPRFRLEDFVVGESNRMAYNAAARLAEETQPGEPTHLFIHGPCGLGKTHLLHGVAQRFRERQPGAVVRLTSGESFMNDFVASIRSAGAGVNGVEKFRRAYRRCDLLCIDDVHFLAAKQATQEELLHTFDEIERGGAKVILVSDQHPRALRKFSPALVSRFMAGMVASIAPPESGLRERIIRVFAQRRGLPLDDAAIRAVASRTGWLPGATGGPSIRDIEGTLTKIDALRRVAPGYVGTDGRIGAAAVERALGGAAHHESPALTTGARSSRPVRMHIIIAQTCAALSVESADLAGRTRHKRVVLARAIITYLSRVLTTQSFPDIARAIGRPAHSTVITAFQRFSKQLAADEAVVFEHAAEPTTLTVLVRQLTESIVHASARE